jgi:hypothetical protein
VGLRDLGVRHLDELRALEHGGEGIDQVRIGFLERGGVEARVRVDLGVEVEIVVAQPLELAEIFVMIDRRERTTDLAEFLPLCRAGERSERPARRL